MEYEFLLSFEPEKEVRGSSFDFWASEVYWLG